MIKELVQKNRSYRRFHADEPIDQQTLLGLVDLARWVASARNLQPLRYIISCDDPKNGLIFSSLNWPEPWGWLKPAAHERPTGYIILLGDTTIHTSVGIDAGIAAQTILLSAVEHGWGGCIIGMVQHEPLRSALHIPERYRILLVICLGKPLQTAIIEEGTAEHPLEDPTAFWNDEQEVWHVAKRSLKDVLLDC